MADTPKEPKSPFVKIAEAIGGSVVAIFFIACFFGGGREIWPAAAAAGALSILGLGLAYFATKPR